MPAPVEKKPRVLCPVFIFKMSEPLTEAVRRGPAVVTLALPRLFLRGTRIFLCEWIAGATGRGDLCTVEGNGPVSPPTTTAPLYETRLYRNWGWARPQALEAVDHRLAEAFSLEPSPDEFTILNIDALKPGAAA